MVHSRARDAPRSGRAPGTVGQVMPQKVLADPAREVEQAVAQRQDRQGPQDPDHESGEWAALLRPCGRRGAPEMPRNKTRKV